MPAAIVMRAQHARFFLQLRLDDGKRLAAGKAIAAE
jgi:hypothetical protein